MPEDEPWETAAERPGIGLYAETGLHASLKRLYAGRAARRGEARFEAVVMGKVVDLVLPDELVEVQTRNLGSICDKVLTLACHLPVRVVHPVAAETVIERADPESGLVVSSRRSPARRDFFSVFDELVRASAIVASPNVRLDVVLVRVRELRVRDGSGSWRRKGDRTLSRELVEVTGTVSLDTRADWLSLIPPSLAEPFDSASLGAALGIEGHRARKVLYVLRRASLLRDLGKQGNRKLFGRVEP